MLKVKKIEHSEYPSSSFYMYFEIDTKKDGLLAQEVYRAIIHTYCSESSFGYNEKYEEILEFDYPLKSEILLGFDKNTGRNFYSSKRIKKLAEADGGNAGEQPEKE